MSVPASTDEPQGAQIESSRVLGALCACGHRLIYHGDRAVAACDGGFRGGQQNWTGRALCPCGGWERVRSA